MKPRKSASAALFAITLGLLNSQAGAQSPVVGGEVIGTPELVAAACAEKEVLYYTAQRDADERTIVQAFQKQFPCLRVSVISAVTGRLYERVQTEAQAGKTQADVLLITDEALVERMISDKLLAPWTPPSSSAYPPNAQQKGWWYAASGALMYFVYNTESVTAAEAPKTWKDLLDPRWKGHISMAPVTTGGTSWIQFYYLATQLGDAYLPALAAQEPKVFPAYNGVVLSVARGETKIGLTNSLDVYPLQVGQGAPIRPVYPPEAVPVTNYPMMLMAAAPHPHAAELFGNWYLSKAGQAELVRVRGVYSARGDVAPAAGNPPLTGMKLFNPGHDVVLAQHDKLVEDVTKVLGRR